MVFHAVNFRHQYGNTLIELQIASLVGLMVLGTIGSVFIQGFKLTNERSKQLLLEQSLSTVMMQIKEDIHRAGFNTDQGHTAVLSGALATIHVDPEQELVGYVYHIESEGTESFRNVVFKREESSSPSGGSMLKICEKHSSQPLSVEAVALSGPGGFCFNLFNPKQISISNFSVQSQTVASEMMSSRMVTLSLTGHLLARVNREHRVEMTVLQRNQ
ncbi:pilus assembly protein PilW [Vibrio sp. M260118]|uniref:pilus assembly protein PilW n=1 Tax=Vibrio sp. M260118 TaxID=3020896 RepID=UPI002F412888